MIRRPWTEAEKRIVVQGFWGRAAIAIEPLLGAVVFLGLAVGMALKAVHDSRELVDAMCIGGIFALACVSFLIYAVCLMLGPFRALLSTSQPIFIVDGYVRSRPPDERASDECSGFVAVLTADSQVACEWPAHGDHPLETSVHPAHVEFSEYGGIHKIDGQSTGVLPSFMPALSVGVNSPQPPRLKD